MSKALEYLLSQPLLCTVEAAEVAASVVAREGGPEAVEARRGRKVDDADAGMYVRDGVAVIPVCGPIYRYANMFTDLCGGVTTEGLAKDLTRALDNPAVAAVLLRVDSPGGEASGIGELAAMVRSADRVKPVCAYAGDQMCSAAAWVGMAAGEVVCSETASVGSIGVVMGMKVHGDRAGSKSYEFVSTQSPDKRPDPATEAGKALIQKRCDDLCTVFIRHVAAYRGTTPEAVAADFGKGGVLIGADAVAAGMADAVGDFESTLARLARGERLPRKTRPKPSPTGDRPQPTQGKPMPSKFAAALSALFRADPAAAEKVIADAEAAGDDGVLANLKAFAAPLNHGSRVEPDPAGSGVQPRTEDQIRAEMQARFDADQQAAMRDFYAATASDWFDSQVAAGRALPKDKARTCALYAELALADRRHGPVAFKAADGREEAASRLSLVTAPVTAAAPNGRTREFVPQAGAKQVAAALHADGLTVMATDTDPEDDAAKAAAAARRREFLTATAAGRATLAAEAK